MQQKKIECSQANPICSRDLWLLLGWLSLGTILRFVNLGDKPASSIEIATLGFSLGHGFSQIPLDRLISGSTLLSPLKLDLAIHSADVVNRLLTESTHPPLYFWLTHWWIEFFIQDGELISLHVGRSLSAILGGLAIPAMFGLSWLAFRDRLTAHLTAILVTFSPYGIYLAQEARHYTLSILWIIASLSCLIAAIQRIYSQRKISWWISAAWIVINSLGIATHYFFSLTLVLEVLVIVRFWYWQKDSKFNNFNYWLPIIVAGLGTLVGCLVWLPVASNIPSNELTDWIETGYDWDEIWQPIPRLLAWLITMVIMLPIEGVSIAIAICSGTIVLLSLIWAIPALIRGYKSLCNSSNFALVLLNDYVLGSVIIYLGLIYGYGKDVSLAARYHFVYFPVMLLILAAILVQLYQACLANPDNNQHKWFYPTGKKVIAVILTMSLLGSLTVVNNFGYQKSRQSNLLVEHIQTVTTVPAIIGTTYETLSQLRESIALALAWENSFGENEAPQFLLLRRNQEHDSKLNAILSAQPKPFDLWGVNLRDNESYLNQINCIKDKEAKLSDSGFYNRVYHCS